MTGGGEAPAGFAAALSELKNRQKTNKGAPAYSRLVNRPLGRLLAAAAYTMGLTPNQVTFISGACTLSAVAAIALVPTSRSLAVVVTAALVVGYALDAADGQLARLRGGGSVVGEWLDHVVDAIKIATIHTAVLIAWYRFRDLRGAELLVPIAFQASASVSFFVIILNDQLRRARMGTTGTILKGSGKSSIIYSLAVSPTDYGVLCLSFLFLSEAIYPYLYGALMVANVAFLVLALGKWFKEMRGVT